MYKIYQTNIVGIRSCERPYYGCLVRVKRMWLLARLDSSNPLSPWKPIQPLVPRTKPLVHRLDLINGLGTFQKCSFQKQFKIFQNKNLRRNMQIKEAPHLHTYISKKSMKGREHRDYNRRNKRKLTKET